MDNNSIPLRNKKVLVIGLGLLGGGAATVRYLQKQQAIVRVTDKKTKNQLQQSLAKLRGIPGTFGKEKLSDIDWADLIVKNPGVPVESPLLVYARKLKKPIISDLWIFYNAIGRNPDIAVTGTRGKSTTVAIIREICKKQHTVYHAGNSGVAALTSPFRAKKSLILLELSSWQIEDAYQSHISPHVGVFTNFYPDHLNRYKSLSSYRHAKEKLFLFQKKSDWKVLNYDQKETRKVAKISPSGNIFFSLQNLPPHISGTYLSSGDVVWQHHGKKEIVIHHLALKIPGRHNIANVLAAVCVAKIFQMPNNVIANHVQSFKGVDGRLQQILKARGVVWYNDTTATTPIALVTAYDALRQKFPHARLHFICGGQDKNLPYTPLKKIRKDKNSIFYLLPGTAQKKIRNALGKNVKKTAALSLKDAVQKAKKMTSQGDCVILSPGAASFNMFKNEFDRGAKYETLVKQYGKIF